MSVVTTVILILGHDPDGATLSAISQFSSHSGQAALHFGGNICEPRTQTGARDWPMADRYLGGTKMAECDVFIGAWNYFDHLAFLEHLKTVLWASPEDSCVVIQSSDQEFVKVFQPNA